MPLVVTRTTNLLTDIDENSSGGQPYDVGDTLFHRVDIQNTGATVNNAMLTDTLNGSTIVAGTLNVTPIANNDAYAATGNTLLEVGEATTFSGIQTSVSANILGNDVDALGGAFKITAVQAATAVSAGAISTSSAQGGSVTVVVDGANAGSFSYVSAPGFVGTDTFTYTIRDTGSDGVAGNSDDLSSTATVTITVTSTVWYIDAAAAPGGNGTSSSPFKTVAEYNAVDVDDPNDFIYMKGPQDGTITLETGQQLIGTGAALVVNSFTLASATATKTQLTHSADGVVLASNNTIKGMSIEGTSATAIGVRDNGTTGNLVIDDSDIKGQGQAIDIDAGGNLTVTLDELSSTGAGTNMQGVQLAGTASSGAGLISGTFSATSGTIQTSSDHGFQIGTGAANGGGTIAVTYGGNISTSLNGSAVFIGNRLAGSGDINFNGTIFQDSGVSSTSDGIAITTVAAGNINFTGTKTIDTIGGNVNAISVTANSGAVINFSGGALNLDTSNGHGFAISQSGGQVNVSTAADIDATGTGRGISISGSTGGAVNFTGGGLTITTSSGTALHDNNASTGSSLTILGSGNTLATTGGGVLVDISNVGTSALTFDTLNASASVTNATAVSINNLDGGSWTSNSITVAGTSGATSDGIRIQGGSTTNFSLGTVSVVNTGDDGVEINGAGNGTVTIASINIQNTAGQGVEINAATNSVTISGGAIGSTNDSTLEGVLVTGGTGAVTIDATVNKTTVGNVVEVTGHSVGTVDFNGNITASGAVDNGILVNANTSGTIRFDGGMTLTTGASTAFSATSNGTAQVAVTDPGGPNSGNDNVLTTTTGIALNVVSTTIHADDLNFESISKNGGTNAGINLDTTGSLGGLTITGTGTADSGGTIQNITGQGNDGIRLNNTSHFNVSYLRIDNVGGHGINASNLGGSNSITSSFISDWNSDQTASATKDGVRIVNNNTNMTAMVINLTTFDGSEVNSATVTGNDGVFMEAQGTSAMNLRVEGSTFRHMFGDGIQVSSIGGSTGTVNVRIINNDFLDSVPYSGGPGVGGGNGGISITPFGGTVGGAAQQFTVLVQDNVLTDIMKPISTVGAIGGTSGQNVNADFTILNNNISNLLGGRGITFTVDGGDADILIGGNTVNGLGSNSKSAILVNFTDNTTIGTTGAGDIKIVNNTVGNTGNLWTDVNGGNAEAVMVQTQGASTMTALMSGNNVTGNTNFELLRAKAGGTSTINVTITNNILNDTDVAARDELNVTAGYISGQGGTINASITGNTIAAGGDITLREANSGTLNIDHAPEGSAGDTSDLNGNAAVVVVGTPNFNQATPPTPSDPLLPPSFIEAEAPPPAADEPVADLVVIVDEEPADEPPAEEPPVEEPADTGSTPPPVVVIDDGILTEAELGFLVEAAIQRWADAGATAEQIAAMRAVTITVEDLAGLQLGESTSGAIRIDKDAAGWSWFVDPTPGDDSEYEGSGSQLSAVDKMGVPGTRIDLLTVIMHELGHQIGLTDMSAADDRDELMAGTIAAGERRLPGDDDAAAGGTEAVAGALAIGPHNIGTIPAGTTISVTWHSTVDNPPQDRLVSPVSGTATVDGFSSNTNSNPLDSLTIGNLVFLDVNKDGDFDSGVDSGIAGVTLTIFADTDNDGVYTAGIDQPVSFIDNNANGTYEQGTDTPTYWTDNNANGTFEPGTDTPAAGIPLTVTTDAGGLYSFGNLAPGDYIVRINAANFTSGGALNGKALSTFGGADPDDDTNNDNNGVQGTGIVVSRALTVSYGGEPTTDGDSSTDTNMSVDFAFEQPNQAPAGTTSTTPINEDVARTLTVADFGYSDSDGNALLEIKINSVTGGTLSVNGTAVTSFPATITPAQLAANQVVFTPTQHLNGATAGSIVFQVRDDGGIANGGVDTDQSADTLTFNIAAVNDPVTTDAPTTATITQDTPTAVTGLSISDVDAALAPSGVYVVTLSSTQGTMTLATITGLTFSAGDGTGDATMTFRGTLTDINTALATASYTPGAGYTGPAQISLQATDTFGGTVATGSGAATNDSDTVAVTVTASNAAPVIDLNGAAADIHNAATYSENDPPSVLAAALTVSDADDTNIESATVSIGAGFIANQDLLTVNGSTGGTLNGITFAYNATTGVLSLSGSATKADYEATLRLVGFESTSQAPGTSRSISWKINDGTADSATATTTVTVTPVDDPAVAADDDFTTDEATPFSDDLFADNGSGADSDPDNATLTVATVEGSSANVGNQFTLPSGALLTVRADGTFDYDPNGAFDDLSLASTGGTNNSATDSFTYTLVNGDEATVQILINAVDSDDDIIGTAGGDTLRADGGADDMYGLGGNDFYFVNSASDTVNETAGEGKDVVLASVSYALLAGSSVESLTAHPRSSTAALDLTGNELSQSIYGNQGANVIDGGGGVDVMFGFGGNDTYFADNAGDLAIEAVGEGKDVVHASTSYALASGSEIEVLVARLRSSTAAQNLTGNGFNQSIYGSMGANVIDGLGGADVMFGFGGDDSYFVDHAGDVAVEAAGEGNDTVFTSVSYQLGANIEVLIARFPASTDPLNLGGNGSDNSIYGTAGNNAIHGGAGADLMVGFAGDDTYFVDNAGDFVVEAAGEGHDVVLTTVSYALASNTRVEVLAAQNQSSAAAIDLTGNQLGQAIYGSVGDNVINGKGGVDVLFGFAGADQFVFDTSPAGGNFDYIADFATGVDKIVLDNAVYTALSDGALPATAFHTGTAAADADDRIVYDSQSGAVYYDADGNGAGAQVLVAVLQAGLPLAATDFTVI